MIPLHALATTPDAIDRCGPCTACWEEPPQLENRLDGQPKGTPLYCRFLRDTEKCEGPRDRTVCNIRSDEDDIR